MGTVRMVFPGKSSEGGESPTLYAVDDSYIIQGHRIDDAPLLVGVELAEGQAVVEIYARLLDFLAEDGVTGSVTNWAAPVVHIRENGNLVVKGTRVADTAVRHRIALPDHEDAIEVPKAALQSLFQGALCN